MFFSSGGHVLYKHYGSDSEPGIRGGVYTDRSGKREHARGELHQGNLQPGRSKVSLYASELMIRFTWSFKKRMLM